MFKGESLKFDGYMVARFFITLLASLSVLFLSFLIVPSLLSLDNYTHISSFPEMVHAVLFGKGAAGVFYSYSHSFLMSFYLKTLVILSCYLLFIRLTSAISSNYKANYPSAYKEADTMLSYALSSSIISMFFTGIWPFLWIVTISIVSHFCVKSQRRFMIAMIVLMLAVSGFTNYVNNGHLVLSFALKTTGAQAQFSDDQIPVAIGALKDPCLKEGTSQWVHPDPYLFRLKSAPCSYNVYQNKGELLSFSDKVYLNTKRGSFFDIAFFVASVEPSLLSWEPHARLLLFIDLHESIKARQKQLVNIAKVPGYKYQKLRGLSSNLVARTTAIYNKIIASQKNGTLHEDAEGFLQLVDKLKIEHDYFIYPFNTIFNPNKNMTKGNEVIRSFTHEESQMIKDFSQERFFDLRQRWKKLNG